MSAWQQKFAAELADKLTEPQQRCVLALSEEPKRTRRYSGYQSQTAFRLILPGITALGFDMGAMCDTYYLTDLGLAVQAELRAREANMTPLYKACGEDR